jgi:hypothetical protein
VTPKPADGVGQEATVKACGVTVEVAGEELGPHPVDRLMVNMGTAVEPPARSP